MPDALPSARNRTQSDEATIATLARQTDTNRELVRHLYDEEIAALGEVATVKTFIGLIASQRVKQRLRALRGGGAPKRTSSASTSA